MGTDFPRRIAPFVAAGLVAVAGVLVHRTLSRYSIEQLSASLEAIPGNRIALAAACAAGSYGCLTLFDTLALRYVGRDLPYPKIALASFTSLSLGHNIGFAALSSGAIRYRFYSRFGLTPGEIAKVVLFCGVTVGLGLMSLGGIAILARTDLAVAITRLPRDVAVSVGGACLVLPAAYLAGCGLFRGALNLRGWRLALPSVRIALAQLAVGTTNFTFVAGCLYSTVSAAADVPFLAVASAYVIANVTAIVSHVPGGLGVIESVLTLLLSNERLIGALIAFRVVYFFIPLLMGGALLAISEIVWRRSRSGREQRSTAAHKTQASLGA